MDLVPTLTPFKSISQKPTSVTGVKARAPGELAAISSAEVQLRPALQQREPEDARRHLPLRDQSLEDGRRIEARNLLEAHTHETIGRKLGYGEA